MGLTMVYDWMYMFVSLELGARVLGNDSQSMEGSMELFPSGF